jgi:hypothetical protein
VSLELRARVEESGDFSASVEGDPSADRLTFSGRAELNGLELTDIASLIEARSGFEPESGAFHAVVEVHANGGEITAEVRPVVTAPELSSDGTGVTALLKGAAAEVAIEAYTEDVRGADDPALVGGFPVRGTVQEGARPIPTFLAIVATSLGRGLHESLAVPPGSEQPTRVKPPRDDAH